MSYGPTSLCNDDLNNNRTRKSLARSRFLSARRIKRQAKKCTQALGKQVFIDSQGVFDFHKPLRAICPPANGMKYIRFPEGLLQSPNINTSWKRLRISSISMHSRRRFMCPRFRGQNRHYVFQLGVRFRASRAPETVLIYSRMKPLLKLKTLPGQNEAKNLSLCPVHPR